MVCRQICHSIWRFFPAPPLPAVLTEPGKGQVYAVTLYVEADRAAKELGIRSRGGFFADASADDYAIAVSDGAFAKVLQVQLVRKVNGPQFYQVRLPFIGAQRSHEVLLCPPAHVGS